MNKTMAAAFLLCMSVMAASGLAIWMSNWTLGGSLTATSGTEQAEILAEWNITIDSNNDYLNDFQYLNNDGTLVLRFSTDMSGVFSTNSACNFEEDKDLVLYVSDDGVTYEHINESVTSEITMYGGWNTIYVKVTPSQYRCPLAGSYEINAVIV